MEVGVDFYGFYHQITEDYEGCQCDLGDCRSVDKECSLPGYKLSFVEKMAEVYVQEVVARHGVPTSIVSDRDVRFTSRFWKKFHEELGTTIFQHRIPPADSRA